MATLEEYLKPSMHNLLLCAYCRKQAVTGHNVSVTWPRQEDWHLHAGPVCEHLIHESGALNTAEMTDVKDQRRDR